MTIVERRAYHARLRKRRIYLLLTPAQHAGIKAWATDEGRTMPNMIRRILDRALAERATVAAPKRPRKR